MIRILVYRRVLMAAAIVGALCGAALIKGGDAFGATGRRGFELPSAWTDRGTVAEWRAADRQIYRSSAGSSHLDRSRDHIDQEAVYAATRDYRGRLSGLPPAAWAGLDEDERQERRAAAAAR